MKDRAKDRINQVYEYVGEHVVTAIFVTGGVSVLVTLAAVAALGLYGEARYEVKTDCSKDPSGKKCGDLRLEIAKGEPVENPCTSYQRVTSRRGRNCPKFFVPRGHGGASDTEVDDAGEDAIGAGGVEGGTGTGDPAGSGGRDEAGGGTPGGTKPPPKTQEPQSEAEPEPDEVDTEQAPAADEGEAAPEETTEADHPIRSGLEQTVEGAGQTVNGATETVDGAGCKLLNHC